MSMRRQDMRRSPMDVDRLKGNMRMDRKPNATRISDPSHPLGKRKELDNVMRKARQQPANEYWDKKLLEAEDKDPNRWKHSGFKKMYVNGSSIPMQRKSRSPFRKTPVSPRSARIPPSPMRRRVSPERYRERPKSPPMRYARKSPPRPEMKSKEIYRPKRPMSPPPKVRTPSISSCSDSQCSGCSSDDDRRMVDKRSQRINRHGPVNRIHRVISPVEIDHAAKKKQLLRELSPKRRHLKRPVSPLADKRREIASPPAKKRDKGDRARTRIKIEGEKRRHRSPSSGSDDSKSSASEDSFAALTATTRITLNDRFGKMAQWNHDRKYDMNNMKITKKSDGGDRSAVMIQEQNIREASPMRPSPQYTKGEGHYPEELMQYASAQALGLSAWNDDPRVRYDYYKSKGYLRDLTIQDYIKWEEWWYRYQEWLQQERYFEHLERTMMRRRRKKIPIQQRLN